MRALRDLVGGAREASLTLAPAFPPGREDIAAAGALVLVGIAEHAGATAVRISNGGVRWGLVLEHLAPGAPRC